MAKYRYSRGRVVRIRVYRAIWKPTGSLVTRLVPALVTGLVAGVFFCSVAVLLSLLSGGAQLRRVGLGYWELPLIYVGGGALGGVAFALLQPLATRRWGALLVWTIALLPLQLAFAFVMTSTLSRGTLVLVALFAASLYAAAITLPDDERAT